MVGLLRHQYFIGKMMLERMEFDEKLLYSFYPYIHGEELTLAKDVELVEGQKISYDTIYNRFQPLAERLMQDREALKMSKPCYKKMHIGLPNLTRANQQNISFQNLCGRC